MGNFLQVQARCLERFIHFYIPRAPPLIAKCTVLVAAYHVMASGTGQLFAVDGDSIMATASGMVGAHDVAEAPDGTIWVADNFQRRLVQFTQNLELMHMLQGAQFGFVGPRYLDFDSSGIIYVADQEAHRVLKIDPITNEVLGVIGTG